MKDVKHSCGRPVLLLLPSLDEGFGLPALEAMSAGIPVIVSSAGSLPEVVGDAGAIVDPLDVDGLSAAMERAWSDAAWAEQAARAGLARARCFAWNRSAAMLHQRVRRRDHPGARAPRPDEDRRRRT